MRVKLIMILLFIVSINSIAQDYLQRQLEYANNLFESKNYFDAITEYKRLMFFDKEGEYKFDAFYRMAESYKAGAKWDEAIKCFSKASANSNSNSTKYLADIGIVKVNILRRTTERALSLIDSMEVKNLYSDKEMEYNYWRGWALMLNDDWESAATFFAKIDPRHELIKVCTNVEEQKYSVTFAKTISYFIPGAGQIYTGEYLSGLMSLGWNILLGNLTINSFIEQRAFDGIVTGGLLWLRFYRGNLQNAESFAIEKNIEIANQAYRYLKQNYEGIKP